MESDFHGLPHGPRPGDVPPDGRFAPRLDVLRPDQVDAVTGRRKPHASVCGLIRPVEAEGLLRV